MEQNCIRDIVMIIIYRPLSRSGFSSRVVKTFGASNRMITYSASLLNEYLTWKGTLEKDRQKTTHKAQGQQQTLSTTQINKRSR